MVWNNLPGVLGTAAGAAAGVGPESSFKKSTLIQELSLKKTNSILKNTQNSFLWVELTSIVVVGGNERAT